MTAPLQAPPRPPSLHLQGRSPYDDVVQGTGDPDPRDASQLYDDKGRPVNPETKRLNREIVRSHNEVMHVIGVAEPDPASNEAELLAARRYVMYEQDVGDRMGRLGDVLMEVGVWGAWGLRRRVMVGPLAWARRRHGMFSANAGTLCRSTNPSRPGRSGNLRGPAAKRSRVP